MSESLRFLASGTSTALALVPVDGRSHTERIRRQRERLCRLTDEEMREDALRIAEDREEAQRAVAEPRNLPNPFAVDSASFLQNRAVVAHHIGTRLREERLAAGLTQSKLAAMTGLKRPNVSRAESGRHTPSFSTLVRIAGALNVPVMSFVDEVVA